MRGLFTFSFVFTSILYATNSLKFVLRPILASKYESFLKCSHWRNYHRLRDSISDPSTFELEMNLFGSSKTIFQKNLDEILIIEKLVNDIEDGWNSGTAGNSTFEAIEGYWDCSFATIVKGTLFPEKTTLSELTFNRLLPNEKYKNYLECQNMIQYVSGSVEGDYDNGIVVILFWGKFRR